ADDQGHLAPRPLDRLALQLAALFLAGAVMSFGTRYLTAMVGERMVAKLRTDLAGNVLRLSLRFYDARHTGDVISVLNNDVGSVRQGLLDAAMQLLPQVVRLVGSLAMALLLNWRLTLVVLLVAPLTASFASLIGRRVRTITRASFEELGQATAMLNEALASPRVVKAFDREAYETARYSDKVAEVVREGLRRARAQASLGPLNGLAFNVAMTVVLWYGGYEVLQGRLSPGDLVAFLIYFGGIASPLDQVSHLYTQLQQALGAAQRVFALLDERPGVSDRPHASHLTIVTGSVRFEHVWFAYTPERPVLRDLSFAVGPGQTVALVGPSGGGKTTAMALLLRLYDVTAGRITVDGQDIREVTQSSLRRHLALVPQEPVLFGISVAENIRYGRLEATQEAIEGAARAANAHEFIAALPHGYETHVGERGVQLSAGQRQRIAIARAILRRPRILLLDEATASLDNESEQLVQEALERLMARTTTLVVAHRLTTVQHADRVIVLDKGQVAEQGTPAELVAARGFYFRLLTRGRSFPSPSLLATRDS
ncbi:MAG TPA: ABC transporter ATP-binding protein, partial [Chloroflexota bacterium]|nr:ABC transporter ATP-binding protein [Chloroflexota bacterium]